MTATEDRSRFLRLSLRGNGVFSLVSGICLLAADGLVSALLQAYDALAEIHFVGVNLIAFAALLFFVASRDTLPRGIVVAIITADALWVVASWLAIGAGLVAGQGAWTVGIVADIVLAFGILQAIGLRRLGTTEAPA